MQVNQVMTATVKVAQPEDSVRNIARSMAELNAGVIPVTSEGEVIGMITDRDIVIRAIGAGLDPDSTTARDVMTAEVHFCYEDDDVEEVFQSMSEWQIRRLPVFNLDKKLVGIVSLGDIAQSAAASQAGETLRDIST